jgi:uncharacterized membrane protein
MFLFGSISSTIGRGASPNLFLFPFTILGVVAAAGIAALIGYILFMIAMYNLSKYYGEPAIFKNLLNALIIGIVGSIALGIALIAVLALTIGTLAQTATYSPAITIWDLVGLGVFIAGIIAIAIYCRNCGRQI